MRILWGVQKSFINYKIQIVSNFNYNLESVQWEMNDWKGASSLRQLHVHYAVRERIPTWSPTAIAGLEDKPISTVDELSL